MPFIKQSLTLQQLILYILFYHAEEDLIRQQAANFQKIRDMSDVLGSEHIKGNDLTAVTTIICIIMHVIALS